MICGQVVKYNYAALHAASLPPLNKKDVLKKLKEAQTAASQSLRRSLRPTEFVDVAKSFYQDSPDDWDAFWALGEVENDDDYEVSEWKVVFFFSF
jgi:hypothetical protein